MKKNEKINPESKKALKEFHQKQIKTNIKIHIFFLSMISIINICLLNFIIMYKRQISTIKDKSNQSELSIKHNQKNISYQQNSIDHKLVNILSISSNTYGNSHFSLLFEKSEEVNMVKKFISDFTKIENPTMLLTYQGSTDSDSSLILLDIINYFQNTLFIIGTKDKYKFGFFFEKMIFPNNSGFFVSDSNRCFIISFISKEKYECLDNRKTFEVNKNSLFNIGDGDIIIQHNFWINDGIINFPFKSFDTNGIKENIFTKYNGEFEISDIEIYSIF